MPHNPDITLISQLLILRGRDKRGGKAKELILPRIREILEFGHPGCNVVSIMGESVGGGEAKDWNMKTYVLEKTEKPDTYSYFQLTDIESYFNIAQNVAQAFRIKDVY